MKTLPALLVSAVLAAVVYFALAAVLVPASIGVCPVSGAITDGSTGQLIPGATVVMVNAQGGVVGQMTATNGLYSLTPPGCNAAYTLTFGATGYKTYTQSVWPVYPMALNVALFSGIANNPATVTLTVTVTDASNGAPLAGASVTFTQCSGAGLFQGCQSTYQFTVTTNSAGIAVGNLASGYTWQVQVTYPNYQTKVQTIAIGNAPAAMNVSLYANGAVDPLKALPVVAAVVVFVISFLALRRKGRAAA